MPAPYPAEFRARATAPVRAGNLQRQTANDHGASPSQLALAWLLKRSPVIVPIPGTSSVDHLESNVAAADIELTDDEFAIDKATADS